MKSPFLCDLPEIKTKFQVTKDPNDWKYVEYLFPPLTVPEPKPKEHYASGWKPQSKNLKDRPYFVSRTKNYMMPIYLRITANKTRRETLVKKIEGDIWLLDKELHDFLQKDSLRPIMSQVNEVGGYIYFRGDHVNAIKYYLQERGY